MKTFEDDVKIVHKMCIYYNRLNEYTPRIIIVWHIKTRNARTNIIVNQFQRKSNMSIEILNRKTKHVQIS